MRASCAVASFGRRTKIRREMNRADNEAHSKAVDALLNYETVKHFGAEEHEVRRYAASLRHHETQQQLVTTTLSGLNFGQVRLHRVRRPV
jgi:ABC-type transport system involved in Fe-S cluster assembly fused permease/ATPase subunit